MPIRVVVSQWLYKLGWSKWKYSGYDLYPNGTRHWWVRFSNDRWTPNEYRSWFEEYN